MSKSFIDLPVEINLQILQDCGENDVTCLSLTCKFLYIISSDIRTPRPSLITTDKRLCPPHSCPNTHERNRTCNILRWHRRICHQESLAAHERRAYQSADSAIPSVDRNECQTPRWTPHCECFSITLYKRLETWFPQGFSFCQSCRLFTRGCGHDGRFCEVHVRRARWEFLEKEKESGQWETWRKEQAVELEWYSGLKNGSVSTAETSAMGAAKSPADLARIAETWQRMRREAREEMQKKMDEMKSKELELREKEESLKKKEKGLRKREEDLWRRQDKLKELEDRIRKREDQLRKVEDEIGRKGKVFNSERNGAASPRTPPRHSNGFARCPCKGS